MATVEAVIVVVVTTTITSRQISKIIIISMVGIISIIHSRVAIVDIMVVVKAIGITDTKIMAVTTPIEIIIQEKVKPAATGTAGTTTTKHLHNTIINSSSSSIKDGIMMAVEGVIVVAIEAVVIAEPAEIMVREKEVAEEEVATVTETAVTNVARGQEKTTTTTVIIGDRYYRNLFCTLVMILCADCTDLYYILLCLRPFSCSYESTFPKNIYA